MKKISYSIHLLFFISILCSACSALKTPALPATAAMPAVYAESGDTLSSGALHWKNYFTDKTLTSLIDTALLHNWDILMAAQRIAVAQADVQQGKAALQPAVNAVLNTGINKYGDYTMDGAGNKGTKIYDGKNIPVHLPDYFAGFQSSWEVDLWGKLRNRKKAAVAKFLSSAEGKNMVVTGIVAEMATAYYELLAHEQTLKIITETIAVQEKALEIVRVQKETAVTNELAVKQFEAQLLHLKSMRFETMQQLAQTESRMNFLAGRYPQHVERDSTAFSNAFLQPAKTGIPSALLQHRPDIKQASFELLATKADLLAAKAAFYPSLNITGYIGLQAFKPGLLFTTPESIAYGLLGNITAPLVNRAAIKAAFNRVSARQLEALYNYQKTIVNGFVEVSNEMLRIKNLQQSIELKDIETNVLLQGIDISKELFRTGRASYLEVLITQQAALQARLELVNMKKDLLLANTHIYKALGGGWQ